MKKCATPNRKEHWVMLQTKSKNYDLLLYSHAMQILVTASQLQFDVYSKLHRKSIGVDGFGKIDTLERLAGAMNYKGYRTKNGNYIRANNLKQIKFRLTTKYGKDFVSNLVDWESVSRQSYDESWR